MKKDPMQNAWHEVRGVTGEELIKAQEEVREKYGDILHESRPVSVKHRPMSPENRAAQFAPFAALTGYDSAIEETARYTEDSVELDENRKAEIDQILQWVGESIGEHPEVTVTWFVPDTRKEGGEFRTERNRVRKLDPVKRTVGMVDGTEIPIDAITNMML